MTTSRRRTTSRAASCKARTTKVVAPRLPLLEPLIGGNEWTYVKECLDSGWVSSAGPFVSRFERELAAEVGMPHAVATISGTAALHVALLVAGVEPDDEVLVSALSFIAPANAVRYAGAWPVFVDVEPTYWQMDPARVRRFLRDECQMQNGFARNRRTGRRVKALLPVHILGHPCDMDELTAIVQEYGLVIVEDATESLGATYRGRAVGAIGPLACFSFNGNKTITTGGGGMIVTANPEWASRALYLVTQAKDDPVEHVHGAVGFNYRLSNVHAAIGCAQLEQLGEFVGAKRALAQRYAERLSSVPGLTIMREAPWAMSTFWLFTVLVDEQTFGLDRRALGRLLDREGIQTRPLWTPLHLNPIYQGAQALGGTVVVSLQHRALSLPSSVGVPLTEVDRVADVIEQAGRTARGV